MPEHPDEIQYAESFRLYQESDIAGVLNQIIGNDNRIVHFTVNYVPGQIYPGPWYLTVLYEPLPREELERREQEHLLNFGKTER